ncbi:MAG: nucleotide exchange factor GrpE [Verrucomicrobiota bacterium]|jgi:molecular chaperone GrpE|nr:nucleotide exchange factor GrpE [Verrucomicrobiota bacterium]
MFSKKTTPAGDAADATPPDPAAGQPADAPPAEATPPPAEPAPAPEAQELALMKDRYTRLMADFDNFRKRQVREREDLVKRANEDLLGDLLPVVDHLELALAQAADRESPFVVGVGLVYDQLLALLDRYGMKTFDTRGEPFDPTYHEALSQMPSATVPANAVIDQFRRGWLLGGRLLRPAQVIVSSGAPDGAAADAENTSVSD